MKLTVNLGKDSYPIYIERNSDKNICKIKTEQKNNVIINWQK